VAGLPGDSAAALLAQEDGAIPKAAAALAGQKLLQADNRVLTAGTAQEASTARVDLAVELEATLPAQAEELFLLPNGQTTAGTLLLETTEPSAPEASATTQTPSLP